MTLQQMQTVRYGELLKQSDCDWINNFCKDGDDAQKLYWAKAAAHNYKYYSHIYKN